MTLQLEIVSEHRDIVGDDCTRVFGEQGGTIGRSLQNDWILPDPDRYISGRHATIDFKGGIYYLLDTSSNGIYVNGDCEPLGKGNSRRLFNGDRLRLGDFEIAVTIDAGESLVSPLDDTDINLPGHDHSLVEEDQLKTGMLLLDEDELTGDSAFQSALFGSKVETNIVKQAESKVVKAVSSAEAAQVSPANVETDLAARELIDAFVAGLGIQRDALGHADDMTEVMRNAGEVLREFVAGTNKLLVSRANLKSTFRMDQTTVLPRHNNPLKLSTNTRDSIMQLLVGREGEYLGPRDAVREVCRDLLFHQDAFLDAMGAAFADFASRFDPDELEQDFKRSLDTGRLSAVFSKKKYWPLYKEVYPIMTEKGGGRFPQMLVEEFVKGYDQQIAEYKRLVVADDDHTATVALNPVELRSQTLPESSNDAEFSDEEFSDEELAAIDTALDDSTESAKA
jgi:type VI secretion system FHA domain protein